MHKLTRLTKKFYSQNSFDLAQALLGKYLIRKINSHLLIAKIVETEVYYGANDLASHASRGRTARTELMFGQPGLAYIYLIYGMYYCLNIVTEKNDFPAAILIRSLEPIQGIKQMVKNRRLQTTSLSPQKILKNLTTGPGKLCQAMKIDKTLNGENLIASHKLYLARATQPANKKTAIVKTKRIGIDYAGKYKNKLWRYYLKDNLYISK